MQGEEYIEPCMPQANRSVHAARSGPRTLRRELNVGPLFLSNPAYCGRPRRTRVEMNAANPCCALASAPDCWRNSLFPLRGKGGLPEKPGRSGARLRGVHDDRILSGRKS